MEKVSVIIPAYNKADLTFRTVESVLSQTYENIEIIVVDDGSTDGTGSRLAHFGVRIRYEWKENGGACSARNRGLSLATGELVAFLDCDDLYEPDKIRVGVDFLKSHPAVGFLHTAAMFIDADGRVLKRYSHPHSRRGGFIFQELILGNYICNSTVVARRECFCRVGGFNERIFMPADWDMWLRLAEHYQAGYVDQPLTQYRVTDNYIIKNIPQAFLEEEIVINDFFVRNPTFAGFLKRRAQGSLHRRFAQSYLVTGQKLAFQREIIQSFKVCPWDGKTWLSWAWSWISPGSYKAYLSEKILRGGW